MNKRAILLFSIIIITILIALPIIINVLMYINLFPVSGDEKAWISSLSTFWGAILGGVVSGALTLVGVQLTIKSSTKNINETIVEQNRLRERELFLQTSKERLVSFYHPVDELIAIFIFEHGAHNFTDLKEQQQKAFISIVDKNVIYADSGLYSKFVELKWAYKENDIIVLDENYNEIIDLITEEIIVLRDRLKLPKLYNNHIEEDKI